RAVPVAITGQSSWPSAGHSLATYGQLFMAAYNRRLAGPGWAVHTHQTWPARLDDLGPRDDINAGGLQMPRVLAGSHIRGIQR
ncbi:hypothetical protein ACWGKE_06000, partial [Micrococcus luteus]